MGCFHEPSRNSLDSERGPTSESTIGVPNHQFVSLLMAEALALPKEIKREVEMGISSITVFSDCSMIIKAINSNIQIKEIYGVLKDINCISSVFASIFFQHIPNSQNRETDFLAKQALRENCLFRP